MIQKSCDYSLINADKTRLYVKKEIGMGIDD